MGDSDEEFDRRRRDKFRSERREYRDDRGGGGGGRGGGGGGGWEDRYATLSHFYKVHIFVIESTLEVFNNFVEADRTGEEEVVVEAAEIDMEAEKITIGEERELTARRETT